MKRILTLLWLTLLSFSFKASAQTTTCNAEFTTQYINTNTVKFTPVVTIGPPAVAHTWSFGDGSPINTTLSPTHTYAVAGVYTVTHSIAVYNNGQVICTRTFTKQITVSLACTLVVDFNWTAVASNPLTFAFHNLSVPLASTDSIKWEFGDGSTSSAVNPVHTYAQPGTYTVCLTVKKHPNSTNTPCIRTFCKTIVIQAPPCNLVANFSWSATPTNPLRIEFQNLSTPLSNSDSISWNFGDGGTSTAVNPVHTYNVAGTYTVCLRIKKLTAPGMPPCIREICRVVVVTHPCTLVVGFNVQPDSINSLRVKFFNVSTPSHPTDSLTWTFGDGTTLRGVHGDPNVANPIHTYANAGPYNVCLRVKKNGNAGSTIPCIREWCRSVIVTPPCNLVANFNWSPTPGNPLSIQFNNTSSPLAVTDSIRWTFGDGTSSNAVHPLHTYTAPGTYTVCLRIIRYNTVSNTPCIREICKVIVITHPPCNLAANFTSTATPGNALRIEFQNTSTPLSPTDSTIWNFGDGTSSYAVNPVHVYTQPGTYNVCLTVKKYPFYTSAPCIRTICKTIVVHPPCNFLVNFSWRPDSANNRKVHFTNLTFPPTAAATAVWTFGDGTSATSWNAVHEYAQPGRYIVCLKIYLGGNSNCVREKCDTITVPHSMPACRDLSKYQFERFPSDAQKYKFTPDYINPGLQYTWTFGDGTGSRDPIAIHRYAQPGVYIACLTVWRGPDCAATTCKEIRVQMQVVCDTAHVSYSYQADPQVPNKLHFYASASLPILDQVWTISRPGSTLPPVILHQNNPVYTFPDTGYYRVCLKATLLGGCVKEYCSNIRIQHASNSCTLQAYPNPTTSHINVNVFLSLPEMIHAYIHNTQNVLVMEKHQQGTSGNNLVTMNVQNLPAGQYVIKVITVNRICYATFQKL